MHVFALFIPLHQHTRAVDALKVREYAIKVTFGGRGIPNRQKWFRQSAGKCSEVQATSFELHYTLYMGMADICVVPTHARRPVLSVTFIRGRCKDN